jgi:hypothetical protein
VLALALVSGRSVRDVRREFGVNQETLRNWVEVPRQERRDGPDARSAANEASWSDRAGWVARQEKDRSGRPPYAMWADVRDGGHAPVCGAGALHGSGQRPARESYQPGSQASDGKSEHRRRSLALDRRKTAALTAHVQAINDEKQPFGPACARDQRRHRM